MKLNLGDIQFYWRMIADQEKESVKIPSFLPFEFGFNEELQLIKQNTSQQILDTLDEVYKYDYNVGYLQDGHDLAEGYANDFLKFFKQHIENKDITSIFEIGCGGGYLLKRIKQMGRFKVTCLDPSPVALKNKEHFDIVSSFYPCKNYKEKVDLIIHYDVLEHIENPVEFLKAHKNNLTEDGYILFAVPDCTNYISIGDVSMVLHEHINYFDKESLTLTVQKAGFENITVEKSNHGGVLYCFAQNSNKKQLDNLNKNSDKFTTFVQNYKNIQDSIDSLINENKSNTIGFYVPLRALPYISKYKNQNFRFFDDDSGIHGKFFDGFDIPIENFEDLKNNPVDLMFIMSDSFGEKIMNKINNHNLNIEIRIINNITKKYYI